jgi:hypothetical protein
MDNLHKIPILIIRFANEITTEELPFFRGAIIGKVPNELTLFHNHIDTGFRYSYPLIQYKRINGKAAIVCIGEGTEAIGNFFASADFNLQIGNRQATFQIENMQASQWLLQPWDDTFSYTISRWLPFNSDNYAKYKQLNGMVERVQMLEQLLVGNILSMCTGLGVHVESAITCQVQAISREYICKYKGIKMQAINLTFRTNVYLHNFIALGKGVSQGFGIVKLLKNHQYERNA